MQVEPGVYYGIPFDDYKQWDATNWSKLKLAKKSPLHFIDSEPIEPTKAMRLGSGVHDGFLEPARVAEEYAVMPNYACHPGNTTKDGKQSTSHATKFVETAQAEFLKANIRKTIVPQKDYDAIVGCVAALKRNDFVCDLVKQGDPEVSIVWHDDEFDLLCKCRVDWLDITGVLAIITDLKTTADCQWFESQIDKLLYYGQMAFYRRGVMAALDMASIVNVIAIEAVRPYGNMAAPMDEQDLLDGSVLCEDLLSLVSECKRNNVWPGYANPIKWTRTKRYSRVNDDELVEVGE